jgi:hypothetical protein
MLWVTGTNDFAYPFPSLQKSYRLPRGPRTLAIRVRMRHSHPDGAVPEEIAAFADAMLKKGVPLPEITRAGDDGISFKSKREVVKAELCFTNDDGPWQERVWQTAPAELDARGHSVRVSVSPGARAWYVNLFDDKGLVVSSEHRVAR